METKVTIDDREEMAEVTAHAQVLVYVDRLPHYLECQSFTQLTDKIMLRKVRSQRKSERFKR